jgi:hypothetical protein
MLSERAWLEFTKSEQNFGQTDDCELGICRLGRWRPGVGWESGMRRKFASRYAERSQRTEFKKQCGRGSEVPEITLKKPTLIQIPALSLLKPCDLEQANISVWASISSIKLT